MKDEHKPDRHRNRTGPGGRNGDILNCFTIAIQYVPVLTFSVPVENGSFRLDAAGEEWPIS